LEQSVDESTRHVARQWALAQPRVSAFITAVVRDFSDRDDLLQDIAVAVFESFDSYDADRPFVAWAMGVARNQVGLYLHRRRRDRLVFDQATVDSLAAAFADVSGAESRELDFLHDCIGQLDGRGRQLCELRYQKGLKPAAISQAMGMANTAVRKALQRIREQLRACVQNKALAEGV
jgi:RNA polymerase sigma-70 factor (ECF subfamily)